MSDRAQVFLGLLTVLFGILLLHCTSRAGVWKVEII